MLLKSMTIGEVNEDSGRIDPRITRTRKLIESAFMELLWQEGFEAMTVRDIAKQAGVNRATFYAHFEDKYALFTHVIEKGLTEIIQTRLPDEAIFNAENLKLLVLALREFFERGNTSECTSARNQPLRPMIESHVQEKIVLILLDWLRATPGLRLRTTLEMTANLVSWMVFGLGLSLAKSGNKQVDHAQISSAVEVMMNGVFEEAESRADTSKRTPVIASGNDRIRHNHYQGATVS